MSDQAHTFQTLVDMADVERKATKKRYIRVEHDAGDKTFAIVSSKTRHHATTVVCYIDGKRVARSVFEPALAEAQGVAFTGKRPPETTCQICCQRHEMVGGLIAHHGYKRPGGGYQTASCWGARHLPYELSCDMIPHWIARIEHRMKALNGMIAQNVDAELPIPRPCEQVADGYKNGRRQYKRVYPDDRMPGSPGYEVYRQQYIASLKREAKESLSDISFLEERIKNWVLKEIKA
jgi:hypothetical protein